MKQAKQKYNKRKRQCQARFAKYAKQRKVVIAFSETERNRAMAYLANWVNL